MRVALYWNTLRHLRPVQIWSRIAFLARHPRPDESPAPPQRARVARWVAPPLRPASQLASNRFRFLDLERALTCASDWNNPEWEKLWLYNLHYFDDLAAASYRDTMERWIAENPPVAGNGWEPYPSSLRIVNWIKWALGGESLSDAARRSLAVQCRHLAQRLEWHLLGNHLLANAKALVFAGCFFEGSEADRWLALGRSILGRELPEQVLPDGAHFELSPMYHAIILEDLLDMVNLSRVYEGLLPREPLEQCAVRMLHWLRTVTHPDGEIAFFNDAAVGIASAPQAVADYASRLDVPAARPAVVGAPANYLRLQAGNATAILDAAPIGPDYLPGHAHADTLSFELSLGDERVVVNSGTSTYAASAERLRQRSTAAHSTVEIDGESSSEVWSSFRVARRARAFGLQVTKDGSGWRVSCAHDGYRRLPGKPVHRREWVLTENELTVLDHIDGLYSSAVARFYFHPDCAVIECTDTSGSLRTKRGVTLSWSLTGGRCRIVETTYHPRFGATLPNRCLEVATVDTPLATHFNWRG